MPSSSSSDYIYIWTNSLVRFHNIRFHMITIFTMISIYWYRVQTLPWIRFVMINSLDSQSSNAQRLKLAWNGKDPALNLQAALVVELCCLVSSIFDPSIIAIVCIRTSQTYAYIKNTHTLHATINMRLCTYNYTCMTAFV
jgi:hypothetical protein